MKRNRISTRAAIELALVLAVGVLALVSFTGCATLFKGTSQKVGYSSEPMGAKVYVNGQLMGTTPFEMEMKANRTYTIEFRKEGYENKTVVLNNSIGAGWIILDMLGGFIPVIIDAATGAWYSLDQDHVNAALEAQQKSK
ncbi:MAG: PEGA domain-containing protein [Spirochaetes bacterium]|nr:PEGA domain-containing protein [Spirochaetota bacterium]